MNENSFEIKLFYIPTDVSESWLLLLSAGGKGKKTIASSSHVNIDRLKLIFEGGHLARSLLV